MGRQDIFGDGENRILQGDNHSAEQEHEDKIRYL